MSIRYLVNSLSQYCRQLNIQKPPYRYSNLNYPIFSTFKFNFRMASSTSGSQCQCPSDEDKLAALKTENVTRVDRLRQLLTKAFKPTQLEIEDMSGGCGAMFSVTIASELFKDKKMIQQHRMVNEVLKEELKTIHALTLDTIIP